ncbi:MAG: PKD domain-containing protein [Lewinellaceae bacterium]|nr:PKD domain-containing protein [Lewinellaceae bacterium]
MKTFAFIFFLYSFTIATAQNPGFFPRYDNVWLTGYDSYGSSLDWGGTRIDFSSSPPTIIREDRNMDFYVTNASISDINGGLLFYTNANYIANRHNDTLQGGSILNPNPSASQNINPQGVLILPFPEDANSYIVFHSMSTFDPTPYSYQQVYHCLYSKIDMQRDSGLGGVIESNKILLKDTLDYGKLTACKHANGRDWWILVPKWNSANYFTFLLTPSGIESLGKQKVGEAPISNAGQALFSPDGAKYVRYNSVGSLGGYLDIYNFDRCTGVLSNCQNIHLTQVGMPGAAISPNSQYLYLANGLWLHQYDLQSDNILDSEILLGTYDGYLSPANTFFFLLQLAPDGKLYMNSAATVNTMHIVHQPDLPGATCRFEQHGVQLPTLNSLSMPNFPNYRLGPLDGSPCDTLGLDNLPAAHFRWEFWDTLTPLNVSFTDLSIYEPATWQWDFGDGTGSTEKDPEHLYPAPGVYTVCLKVSNGNGADSICYPVTVGVSSEAEVVPAGLEVAVAPNPFQSVLAFSVSGVEAWQRVNVVLRDIAGRTVAQTVWRGSHSDWQLEHLPRGVYMYELRTDDGRRAVGKVVKT